MGNFTNANSDCSSIATKTSMSLQMKSRNSNIMFQVDPRESFSEIACRYSIEDHCPPGGCEMRYKDVLIVKTDTPESLGMRCGDIVEVSW